MVNLVEYEDGKSTTTSKIISEVFGKTHRHTMDAVKNLECSDEFRGANFRLTSYTSSQNKQHKCYRISRDGFMFLAMGFTGKSAATWKEAYIKAFNEMEGHIIGSPTFMEKINDALKILEDDKEKASICATGLSRWRKIKKQRESEVKKLINQAQLILKLEA